jgi:hypothetical protein
MISSHTNLIYALDPRCHQSISSAAITVHYFRLLPSALALIGYSTVDSYISKDKLPDLSNLQERVIRRGCPFCTEIEEARISA